MARMRYRLALDLGPTSLGWSIVRLNGEARPCAVVRAGVRIFSDGRNPKDGASLAVTRRNARAMRRRRDRLLTRKARVMRLLIEHGFFPADEPSRKALERLNPYELRAKGLDEALTGPQFARALFHINQRRGFLSNRRTDSKDSESGALKSAISKLRQTLAAEDCRTVGEWLRKRQLADLGVRARFRQTRLLREDGKPRIDKSYDFYVERAMVAAEFDALWATQAKLNPALFTETARSALKDALLHQRKLRPVIPGRCTLLPDEERAPLALPTTQRFRIHQEVNNLRILRDGMHEEPLTAAQRDAVVHSLERNAKRSFTQIRKLLGLPGSARFNIEDPKREELKGNVTSAILSRKDCFSDLWLDFTENVQDRIVLALLGEEDEGRLVSWLQAETGIDEATAERIANAALPEGYGSLSQKALQRVLPELRRTGATYDKAVLAAGFEHHSQLAHAASGEILPALPYYGEYLQRHVGFGSGRVDDPPEKRYGRIANPTVHIGLNQVRTVVNALIARYGHPLEVIVEVARELKQSQDERREETQRQAQNQSRNARLRADAAQVLGISPERVHRADIEKMILWEELSHDVADRRCPYSGAQISVQMLLSDQAEVEHILPFSDTLDDSLNNKTVATRAANRVKGNRTPWAAREDLARQGWDYDGILDRAAQMPRQKRYRFADDGYARWLKEDKDFLARALNDTRHLSRVAREYLSLICPQGTRVIPGRMTALLRRKFGLNDVLGVSGEKNRNDHRHHAVDACVIAVTDQGMLLAFSRASASAREKQLDRLVDAMPLPWPSYREHVARAVSSIRVSHKPDHSHEGAMHNDTAYALLGAGRVRVTKVVDGIRTREEGALKVIEMTRSAAAARHGVLPDGAPKPYKGYKGDSNYCIEIHQEDSGAWGWRVVSTYEAYQVARSGGIKRLRDRGRNIEGRPLVMRLMIGDYLRAEFKGEDRLLTIRKIKSNGSIFVAQHNEANVRQREDAKDSSLIYGSFTAGSLRKAGGRCVSVNPVGDLHDPGFLE